MRRKTTIDANIFMMQLLVFCRHINLFFQDEKIIHVLSPCMSFIFKAW